MKRLFGILTALMMSIVLFTACGKSSGNGELLQFGSTDGLPKVTMTVADYGDIVMVLYPEVAPKTVENFITHAKNGYYDGVEFHRVINDFMIQGGDPTATGAGGQSIWGSSFEDEFSDKLYAFRGALCMANAGQNTNGSQFFIVQCDSLTTTFEQCVAYHQQAGYGVTEYSEEVQKKYEEVGGTPHLDGMHTVFGQVIEGMDVVDTIAEASVDSNSKPTTAIKIESILVEE